MEDSIATASKNVLQIKRRKATHLAFRAAQKITGDLRGNQISSILLYPSITMQAAWGDLINRLAWYLPDRTIDPNCTIYVHTTVDGTVRSDVSIPSSQAKYNGEHLPIETVDAQSLGRVADHVDRILVWDRTTALSTTLLKNISKIEFIDPSYFSATEANTWERMSNSLRTPLPDTSRENYRQLAEKSREFDHAFVFATGPSLDRVTDFDFPTDSLKIVCNSIVRNEELLEHINPDVLVFADPVFHFGPSRYADKFRRDAVEALQKYDCVGVIPDTYLSLLSGHYPELNLIGISRGSHTQPNFPTHDDLSVWGTGNIMTLFMLPIASQMVDDVYILGADGRKEDESYFWEHNDDAQYDDELMQTVADCHPAFFRDRIYTDYYERHTDILAQMLAYGERRGVRYHSLTHSYVPCLKEREVSDDHFKTDTGQ